MSARTVEPRRLDRQIADQIAALTRAGEYRRGARLPPERELAKRLGVSRRSVSEALIALEVEGLVEVCMGSDVYVTDARKPASHRAAQPPDSGPFEVIDARHATAS